MRSTLSDDLQGIGWWLASDGKWYPPDLHPTARFAVPGEQARIAALLDAAIDVARVRDKVSAQVHGEGMTRTFSSGDLGSPHSARGTGVRTIEPPAKVPGYDTPIPCRALEVRTGRTGRLRRGAPRSRSPRGPRPGGDLTSGKGRIPRGHRLGRPPGLTAPRPRRQRSLSPLEPRPLLLLRYPDGSPKRAPSPARRPVEACLFAPVAPVAPGLPVAPGPPVAPVAPFAPVAPVAPLPPEPQAAPPPPDPTATAVQPGPTAPPGCGPAGNTCGPIGCGPAARSNRAIAHSSNREKWPAAHALGGAPQQSGRPLICVRR